MTNLVLRPTLTGRLWGMTLGKREHVAADISFTVTPNRLRCQCGEMLEAPAAEQLGRTWQDHGGGVMSLSANEAQPIEERGPAEMRARATLAAIAARQAACTCATTDVRDCPNYVTDDDYHDGDADACS
jgi:hypothetical protein